jgi:uncharacterized protein (TIGR03118 family)
MEMSFGRAGRRRAGTALAAATLTAVLTAAVGAVSLRAAGIAPNQYLVHNLVSDSEAIPADHHDANLLNAWGLTRLPTSPWWVADNHADVSTLYRADGTSPGLVVQVAGGPTGAVANGGTHFVVHNGSASGAARFLFASEDGKIRGWSPAVLAAEAVVGTDRSSVDANYKGLAIASTAGGDFLYAADFHNARVDVFDGGFGLVDSPGTFVDPRVPTGYAPFGIQNIEGRIFVAYAKQDEDAEDEVAGQGLGFVDVYDTAGALVGRVATHGRLNAPWGLARAPEGFGRFSGDVLVGNFGDGQINAYEPNGKCGLANEPLGGWQNSRSSQCHFTPDGTLRGPDHSPIEIDGLWGIAFGGGNTNSGPATTLFFAAGPGDEEHGLFGTVVAG